MQKFAVLVTDVVTGSVTLRFIIAKTRDDAISICALKDTLYPRHKHQVQ